MILELENATNIMITTALHRTHCIIAQESALLNIVTNFKNAISMYLKQLNLQCYRPFISSPHKPKLKLFQSKVQAGFPTSVDEAIEGHVDLNETLIKNPISTFILKVKGLGIPSIGVYNDDILIVDKGITVKNDCLVVAVIDEKLTPKIVSTHGEDIYLLGSESDPPVFIHHGSNAWIWGVVTASIHNLWRHQLLYESPESLFCPYSHL